MYEKIISLLLKIDFWFISSTSLMLTIHKQRYLPLLLACIFGVLGENMTSGTCFPVTSGDDVASDDDKEISSSSFDEEWLDKDCWLTFEIKGIGVVV